MESRLQILTSLQPGSGRFDTAQKEQAWIREQANSYEVPEEDIEELLKVSRVTFALACFNQPRLF